MPHFWQLHPLQAKRSEVEKRRFDGPGLHLLLWSKRLQVGWS